MHALLASQTQCRGKANGHPEWRWRPLVRRGDWLSGDEQGTVHGQLCIRSFSSSTLKHPPISTVASLNTFSPPSPSPFEPSFTRRLFSGQSSGQRGTYVHNSFHKTPSPSVLILTRPDPALPLPLRSANTTPPASFNPPTALPSAPATLLTPSPTEPDPIVETDSTAIPSHSLSPLASSGLRSARLRALNCPACRVCVRSCNGELMTSLFSPDLSAPSRTSLSPTTPGPGQPPRRLFSKPPEPSTDVLRPRHTYPLQNNCLPDGRMHVVRIGCWLKSGRSGLKTWHLSSSSEFFQA
ncbi:hypothetical protein HDK90DRAFT_208180 [Phyllosticta capitalensis]|uniref:Uncharacterized protein n=1 Tax=Phyllosticta capitalensis TaxID=121624 RepID=A0ABR1YSG7_9PEZI